MKPHQKFLSGIALTLFAALVVCLLTAATPPPVNRNGYSTNIPPGVIDGGGSPLSNVFSLDLSNSIITRSNLTMSSTPSGNTNLGDGSALFGFSAGGINFIDNDVFGGVNAAYADGATARNTMGNSAGSALFGYSFNGTNSMSAYGSFMLGTAVNGLNSMAADGSLMVATASSGTNRVTASGSVLFGRSAASMTLTASGAASFLYANADADFGSAAATAKEAIRFGSGGTNNTAHSFQVGFGPTNNLNVTASGVGIGTVASGDVLKISGGTTHNGVVTNNNLTATTIMGVDGGKREVSVALSGATFDGTTLTITPTTTTNIAGSYVDSVTIPIGAWSGVNAASPATSVAFTNTSDGFSFADAASNSVHMLFSLPSGWTVGTVQASIAAVCTGTNGPTATNVVFGVKAAALGDQDNWANPTYGTEVWVTNHLNVASNIAGIGITGPITVGSTPSAAKTILWNLTRVGGQAGDTLTNGTVIATEFRLFYTRTNTTVGPVATVN